MRPVTRIDGTAVPLDRSDVDTDQIIPSEWLKRVERTGFDEGLFSEWRDDPEFVLNDARFDGASVLVAGENFGTGSSREHAVWAIQQYGFDAVVSPRFGPIFVNNATKCGVVPVTVSEQIGQQLMEAVANDPSTRVIIDVENRRIQVPSIGIDEAFDMTDAVQYRLVNGLDDIGLTLRHEAEITAFEATRPSWLPEMPASA
jgi:3-isopropylmalate/(R)-2-methylmalate dehydratase small subunit